MIHDGNKSASMTHVHQQVVACKGLMRISLQSPMSANGVLPSSYP